MFNRFTILCLSLSLAACSHLPTYEKAELPFSFEKDRFAFANETVWNYHKETNPKKISKDDPYSRRCFVMSRATLQFWKFAHFAPQHPKLSQKKLARYIRQITKIPVWKNLENKDRIVIPGYANLYEATTAEPLPFQKNIGLGWPTYFRFGNFPIVFPPTSFQQEKLHHWLQKSLKQNYPAIVWLINFPSLSINHAVVVFASQQTDKIVHYQVYDPNLKDRPLILNYDLTKKEFSYEKTFYFAGRRVKARPVYLSHFQ